MFLLPLIFSSEITDMTLLPRQLLLSVFGLLLLGSVWNNLPKDTKILKIDAVNGAMIVYFVVATAISLLNAAVLSEALYFLSRLWIVVSFSILTVLLLRNNVITSKHIIIAVIIFGCAGIGTAIIDIGAKTLRGEHVLRRVNFVSGGFGNKNLLSSILFLCLPFFFLGMREKRLLKIITGVALVLALFIIIVIRTRIVLVATLVFFGIIACYYLRDYLKRKFWPFVGSAVAATVLILFVFNPFGAANKKFAATDNVAKYFSRLLNTDTFRERLLFWKNSLEMFRDHPLGVGLGNWQIHFPKYGLQKFNSFPIENGLYTLQRPHNDFLWSLCETGILGFVAFAGIFGILIYQSARLIKTATDERERRKFIYLFSGIIGFVAIAFFDFPMERIEHQVVLVMLFALVIHHYGTKTADNFTLSIKKKIVGYFVVLGICFSFTVAYKRLAAEKDVFKMYAIRKNSNVDEIVSLVDHAQGAFYKIDSKTTPLEWFKGVAIFSREQYADAEIAFEKAYALTPYDIHVINNLASCYEINGKRNEALAMYNKALQISPRFEEARLNLAAVYFNSKAYDKAFNTIDYCAVDTRDPKYKIFLPPILKAKVDMVVAKIDFPVSAENKTALLNVQDFSPLYYESKKNNVTFEQQIISQLKKSS
jgi:O-antigen ligase